MSNKKAIKFIVLLLLLLGSASLVNAQCGYIQADKFDNVWVVNHSEIICFNKQLKKVGSYSNLVLGNPTYIDVLDPFRVIVFYKNSQAVAILNNKVSDIANPIKLKDKGINDASLVCRSSKGGFWIFDRIKWEILLFDSGFTPTGEKIILETIYSNSNPMFMQEYQGILYLAFKDQGVCRYDGFGAFLGELPIKIDDFFTIVDGSICYRSGGNYFLYSLYLNENKSFESQPKCLPVKIQDRFLYFDGQGMVVHKIR